MQNTKLGISVLFLNYADNRHIYRPIAKNGIFRFSKFTKISTSKMLPQNSTYSIVSTVPGATPG